MLPLIQFDLPLEEIKQTITQTEGGAEHHLNLYLLLAIAIIGLAIAVYFHRQFMKKIAETEAERLDEVKKAREETKEANRKREEGGQATLKKFDTAIDLLKDLQGDFKAFHVDHENTKKDVEQNKKDIENVVRRVERLENDPVKTTNI